MATLTATASTTEISNLTSNFLPFIDMTTLSQSELQALSLSSSSSSSSSCTTTTTPTVDDVVSSTIDRSTFNESIGSRRQTYSRPSPHHHHHHHRRRLTTLLPKSTTSTADANPNPNDQDVLESRTIINILKKLLSQHPDFQEPDFFSFNSFTHLDVPVQNAGFDVIETRKRKKRGRKQKPKSKPDINHDQVISVKRASDIDIADTEIFNKNGVVIDLVALASLEDPFREELKKRTQGLGSEEELLGFFRDLDGQWCSRRRKRKIVDAGEFGDVLPVGWKLLLGLKRKEKRAWVYCRRYIRL